MVLAQGGRAHHVVSLIRSQYLRVTLTLPCSTYANKWLPSILMLRVTLQWTRIPSRAEVVEILLIATFYGIVDKRPSDRLLNTNTLRMPATALLKKVSDLLEYVLTSVSIHSVMSSLTCSPLIRFTLYLQSRTNVLGQIYTFVDFCQTNNRARKQRRLHSPSPHPNYSDEHWCLQFFGVSTL